MGTEEFSEASLMAKRLKDILKGVELQSTSPIQLDWECGANSLENTERCACCEFQDYDVQHFIY